LVVFLRETKNVGKGRTKQLARRVGRSRKKGARKEKE